MATGYHTLTIDGTDVFYREDGPADAPVVLLLHGFPSSSRMYRDLIPLLAGEYHVIAPDYPAFGHSGVPSRDAFSYTFDGLAAFTSGLLRQARRRTFRALRHGLRRAGRVPPRTGRPSRLTALILQNAPLYPEAPEGWWATLGAYWHEDTPARRAAVRPYLSLEAIRAQYLHGVADPTRIDPDNWAIDAALIARPGVDEIMLDLLHDIKNNAAVFTGMQRLLAKQQPPVLVATGANDEIFPEPVVRRVLDDLPAAEYHALPTGHFALEDHAAGDRRPHPRLPAPGPRVTGVRHHQVTVGEHRVHVAETGDPGGPPFLFLHGWPESWRAWDSVLALAGEQGRALAIDLPGVGESTEPSDGTTGDLARIVQEVAVALGLRG